MGVNSLEDIRSFNDYVRQKLLKRVESCPEEMRNWRPSPDKWSVSQQVEHLALAEEAYVRWITGLVEEGRRRGLTGQPRTVDAVPTLIQLGDGPLEAPAEMLPQGRDLAESLHRLEASRQQLNTLYAQLAGLETDQLTLRFRSLQLNAAQVMHLVGLHELRHEKQIAGLLEAFNARC